MAITDRGAEISEEHHRRQTAVRMAITAQLLQLWGAMNLEDVEASWTTIEPAVLAIIENGRRASDLIARDYYRRFRSAEGIAGPLPDLAAELAWREAARVSLRITGPIAAKKAIQAARPQPLEIAFVRMSGAAGRLVGNGGRELIQEAVRKDRRARGFARVTSGTPCAFCAMLAGRGPQYRSAGTAGFPAHDHCGCFPEPVFGSDSKWPGRGREFQALYRQAAAGQDDPLAAFRRAYESL